MVNYCCIPGCRNKDKDGIILYRIPKHLLDDYGKAIRRENLIPAHIDRVCEISSKHHFIFFYYYFSQENILLLLTTVYFFRNIFILINLRRKSVKIICQNEFCQRMQYHRYCHIWVKIQIFKTMLLISVKMWNPFLMTTTTFWEENKKKWYRKMFTKSWFHCHYWCN